MTTGGSDPSTASPASSLPIMYSLTSRWYGKECSKYELWAVGLGFLMVQEKDCVDLAAKWALPCLVGRGWSCVCEQSSVRVVRV